MGIPAENLEITDHPYVTPSYRVVITDGFSSDLPDGLTTKWNTTLVSTIIQDSLFSHPVDIVSLLMIHRPMDRPLNP